MEKITGMSQLILSALIPAALVWGQTGTGNIQGIVKDATGAVVPGAKITAVHTPTSQQYDTTTNGVGFFVFPPIQRGPYEISVQAPGMEVWKGTVMLAVGQTAELNVSLKVGGTATAVTVAGDVTPLVTTNSPTLSNILEKT